MGLGYLLSHAFTDTAVRLGIRLIVLFLAAFALYLPFQRVRRHRLIRMFRQAPAFLAISRPNWENGDHARPMLEK